MKVTENKTSTAAIRFLPRWSLGGRRATLTASRPVGAHAFEQLLFLYLSFSLLKRTKTNISFKAVTQKQVRGPLGTR